jgi:RimJ/RimL family protein N-acetyltransferase
MTTLPTLSHSRSPVVLRPLDPADAPAVALLAGDARIAATTIHVPHPYPPGAAETWIASHAAALESRVALTLGVTLAGSGEVVGAVALGAISRANRHAELSYWIGVPYWGRGLATEAAQLMVSHGFDALELQRIHGACFRGNEASKRVLSKVGMTYEGTLREHIVRNGVAHDLEKYGLLRREFLGSRG